MAEPADMIVPMLREMRAESVALLQKLDARMDVIEGKLEKIGEQQKSFRQALSADSLMSKLVTGEFEERIEALERRVKELEPQK
jgi:polyhydroxyalkanoate synthesis regulator phasin